MKTYEFFDQATQLKAFISVHQLVNGASIGGCRMLPYANEELARADAERLANTMNIKTTLAELPFGGAKAVLMKPKVIADRHALFKAYAGFVNELNGKYITGCDSGVSQNDMQTTRKYSSYVTGLTHEQDHDYLTELTALGILTGLQKSASIIFGDTNLSKFRIAVQGLGKIGFELSKLLTDMGCQIIVAESNKNTLERCLKQLPLIVKSPDEILESPCDILVPCALGGILNEKTVNKLQAKIICGAANNQLGTADVADLLHTRDITFVPDYIVNSGGAIYASQSYLGDPVKEIKQRVIRHIGNTVGDILLRSQAENVTTSELAESRFIDLLKARQTQSVAPKPADVES